MNTELMYDATPAGVNAIPSDAPIVAGYIDGLYQSFPLLLRRFGGKARCVSIGVNIGNLAEWSDVEPGNAIMSPAAVRADWEHKRAHGIARPGFYGDLTRMRDTILPGLSGIPRTEFKLWLADWDGNENFIPLPGGVEAAKQFRSAGPYDISVVNPDAFFTTNGKHHAKNVGASKHDKEENAEFDKWWNQGFNKGYNEGKTQSNRTLGKIVHAATLHPKTTGALTGGGISTALAAILSGAGVHLTPAEWAGITTGLGTAVSWLIPVK